MDETLGLNGVYRRQHINILGAHLYGNPDHFIR
jgi:hypothetical protein